MFASSRNDLVRQDMDGAVSTATGVTQVPASDTGSVRSTVSSNEHTSSSDSNGSEDRSAQV